MNSLFIPMPRRSLIRTTFAPYHVTARNNNREAYPLPLEEVWTILTWYAFETTILFGARIHSLVLMPNHFHLLITTPEEDLGEVMQHFMRECTKLINARSGRSGRLYGARYHWTLVDSALYFAHAYKYLYRNPVRAQLCEKVEDYTYSTLAWKLGHQRSRFLLWYPFGVEEFLIMPNSIDERLEWLNRPFQSEHEKEIQRLLRRTLFRAPQSGWKNTLSAMRTRLV